MLSNIPSAQMEHTCRNRPIIPSALISENRVGARKQDTFRCANVSRSAVHWFSKATEPCAAYWLSEVKELCAAHRFSEATKICAAYWLSESKEVYSAYWLSEPRSSVQRTIIADGSPEGCIAKGFIKLFFLHKEPATVSQG